MRSKSVIGNWKLNGSLASNEALLKALLREIPRQGSAACAVCVPAPYLAQARELLQGSGIAWGAQDVSRFEKGAYTGDVSGAMVAEFGARYAIVGHSERRTVFGDTDEVVVAKYTAARRAKLMPIFCVGETLEEREAGKTEAVLARQIDAVLSVGAAQLQGGLLAYEPVWAIGTGKTATSAQAQEAHAFLRGRIAVKDKAVAAALPILYGGSVKAANATELFAMPDVDGGLVGGASLVAEEFVGIGEQPGPGDSRDLQMHTLVLVLHFLAAAGIIVLVLLQHGKGADMGAAFGSGSAGSLFGSAGAANFLSRMTAVLAAVFFASSLALTYLGSPARSGGVTESLAAPAGKADIVPAAPAPSAPAPAPASPSKSTEIPK